MALFQEKTTNTRSPEKVEIVPSQGLDKIKQAVLTNPQLKDVADLWDWETWITHEWFTYTKNKKTIKSSNIVLDNNTFFSALERHETPSDQKNAIIFQSLSLRYTVANQTPYTRYNTGLQPKNDKKKAHQQKLFEINRILSKQKTNTSIQIWHIHSLMSLIQEAEEIHPTLGMKKINQITTLINARSSYDPTIFAWLMRDAMRTPTFRDAVADYANIGKSTIDSPDLIEMRDNAMVWLLDENIDAPYTINAICSDADFITKLADWKKFHELTHAAKGKYTLHWPTFLSIIEQVQTTKEKIANNKPIFTQQILEWILARENIIVVEPNQKQDDLIKKIPTEKQNAYIVQRNSHYTNKIQPYYTLWRAASFADFLNKQTQVAMDQAVFMTAHDILRDGLIKYRFASLPNANKELTAQEKKDIEKNRSILATNRDLAKRYIFSEYNNSIGTWLFTLSDESMPMVGMIAGELAQAPLRMIGGGAYMAGFRLVWEAMNVGWKMLNLWPKIHRLRTLTQQLAQTKAGQTAVNLWTKAGQWFETIKNSSRATQKVLWSLESTIQKLSKTWLQEIAWFTVFQETMSWIKDTEFEATSIDQLEQTTLLLSAWIFLIWALPKSADIANNFKKIVKQQNRPINHHQLGTQLELELWTITKKLSNPKISAPLSNYIPITLRFANYGRQKEIPFPSQLPSSKNIREWMTKFLISTFDDVMNYWLSALLAKNVVAITFDHPTIDIDPATLARQIFLFKNLFAWFTKTDTWRQNIAQGKKADIVVWNHGIKVSRIPAGGK